MTATVVAAGRARDADVTECAWPTCDAEPSRKVDVPLCDRHAVKTYRAVAELMREVAS